MLVGQIQNCRESMQYVPVSLLTDMSIIHNLLFSLFDNKKLFCYSEHLLSVGQGITSKPIQANSSPKVTQLSLSNSAKSKLCDVTQLGLG